MSEDEFRTHAQARLREQKSPQQQPAADVVGALRAPPHLHRAGIAAGDGGRYPAKATVGQQVTVEADVSWTDTISSRAAAVVVAAGAAGTGMPMQFSATTAGRGGATRRRRHRFSIGSLASTWGSYRHDLNKKVVPACRSRWSWPRVDCSCVAAWSARRVRRRRRCRPVIRDLDGATTPGRLKVLLGDAAAAAMAAVDERQFVTRLSPNR